MLLATLLVLSRLAALRLAAPLQALLGLELAAGQLLLLDVVGHLLAGPLLDVSLSAALLAALLPSSLLALPLLVAPVPALAALLTLRLLAALLVLLALAAALLRLSLLLSPVGVASVVVAHGCIRWPRLPVLGQPCGATGKRKIKPGAGRRFRPPRRHGSRPWAASMAGWTAASASRSADR